MWKKSVFKTENKYPERLKKGLDLSYSEQQPKYNNRHRNFLKTINEKEIEYFKIAKVWLIPEDDDSLETLTTTACKFIYKKKYEIVKKQLEEEKDTNIVLQIICILEDTNKHTYKIES